MPKINKTESKSERAVPSSVYRLQFGPHLNFKQATDLVPYLDDLGIDAVYCSPFFKTPSGSLHGYNIVDSNMLNPELGSEEDYDLFCDALRQRGMGQILDLVPNHVGIYGGNSIWNDVLENGACSLYADFFDIEWKPKKKELTDKVLIPVLGDRYGAVLERGELKLRYDSAGFSVHYWEHGFPISPTTYPNILEREIDALKGDLGADNPAFLELLGVLTLFKGLSDHTFTLCENFELRHAAKEDAKKRLFELFEKNEIVSSYIKQQVDYFNQEQSFDALDALLNAQFFRLAFWRVAAEEINYRRFFDVNELAAIKIENPQVLDLHHRKVFELLKQGKVQGLRIDHPDGLYDPARYFMDLQKKYLQDVAAVNNQKDPVHDLSRASLMEYIEAVKARTKTYPLYVIVEKILDRREHLPQDWAVSGTVGYAFLNALNGLFVDAEAESQFSLIYENYVGGTFNIDELCYQKKKLFALIHMSSEVNTLGKQLAYLSECNRHTRDFTKYNLTVALREVIACYPVYRTYITPECDEPSPEEQKSIQIAVAKAKRYTPSMASSTYDFVEDVLMLRFEKLLNDEDRAICREFVLRFQQITGPVMAKGVEDTVFYLYNRLLSMNEVGGDLGHFGYTVTAFHRQNHERALRWPYNFLTSDTHDTKRSEDVRLRIDVLSEMPQAWEEQLLIWTRLNEKFRTLIDQDFAPTRNTEYFIYQSLIGGWPDQNVDVTFKERFQAYIQKALRESKADTNWINPNEAYEKAVRDFIDGILNDPQFTENFTGFQNKIAGLAKKNALSAWVIKLGTPGVVDVYQGSEFWNYSFVDPDNRRSVDFRARKEVLSQVEASFSEAPATAQSLTQIIENKEDVNLKMYYYWRGLTFRRAQYDIFLNGEYYPLDVMGNRQKHAVAFMRKHEGRCVLFVAGRLFAGFAESTASSGEADIWQNTYIVLPKADVSQPVWTEVFSRKEICLKELEGGNQGFYLSDLFGAAEAVMLTNF